jgi:hypothetical protein
MLQFKLSIIRVIKSRKMRWAGHVAQIGETRNACSILNGRDHLKDLGLHGRIILK